mmetsp:Transcript_8181/g.26691  ORF Transcript_8181/g.26691 Transcript_8181/m.26691 type:complete len:167 (+) Transcript_8181:3-503(+)
MPTAVHAEDGTAALSVLREQFGHFHPILCQQLVLPADASDQPRNEDTQQLPPGAAEYANLAALYCSAVPSQGAEQGADDEAPPGTREMQEWVEAGWAEGFDAEGRAHFGGELAGKSGEDAYIGATELLVATTTAQATPSSTSPRRPSPSTSQRASRSSCKRMGTRF